MDFSSREDNPKVKEMTEEPVRNWKAASSAAINARFRLPSRLPFRFLWLCWNGHLSVFEIATFFIYENGTFRILKLHISFLIIRRLLDKVTWKMSTCEMLTFEMSSSENKDKQQKFEVKVFKVWRFQGFKFEVIK